MGTSLKQLEEKRLAELKEIPGPSGGKRKTMAGWLQDHVLCGLECEITKLSKADLIKKFSPSTRHSVDDPKKHPRSPVNDALLMRTFIWQKYLLTKDGQLDRLNGDLRSFWYQWGEGLYNQYGMLDLPAHPTLDTAADMGAIQQVFEYDQKHSETYHLDYVTGEGGRHGTYVLGLMATCFDLFVRNRIFTFREPFGFFDKLSKFHVVGDKTPSFVLFTEKQGLWPLVHDLAKKVGISAMAAMGEPGLVTMEYFTAQLRARMVSFIRMCALNDFDPWGWEIGDNAKAKIEEPAFGNVLEDGGVAPLQVDLHRLTTLALFDKDVINDPGNRRDLRKVSKQAEVDKWMSEGGGIDGQPISLHVDKANHKKIEAAFRKWFMDSKARAHQDRRKPHPGRRDPRLRGVVLP